MKPRVSSVRLLLKQHVQNVFIVFFTESDSVLVLKSTLVIHSKNKSGAADSKEFHDKVKMGGAGTGVEAGKVGKTRMSNNPSCEFSAGSSTVFDSLLQRQQSAHVLN